LQQVNMASNSLSGTVPDEIETLTNITTLSLGANSQ
jgi:hypothetical protein